MLPIFTLISAWPRIVCLSGEFSARKGLAAGIKELISEHLQRRKQESNVDLPLGVRRSCGSDSAGSAAVAAGASISSAVDAVYEALADPEPSMGVGVSGIEG